ncbi:MAG: T9SS type A sorting domain-containing protein [Saprospiraceae bacterium]
MIQIEPCSNRMVYHVDQSIPDPQIPVTMNRKFTLLMMAFSMASIAIAQNKVQNPGCEQALVGGEIPGWQEITGSTWTRQCGSPPAHSGQCYFSPGDAADAELSQRVDVSDDATVIDSGNKHYFFVAYVRSLNESPADQSGVKLIYRSASDAIIETVTFGPYTNTNAWFTLDFVIQIPVGTRTVDIRLHSTRLNGTSNDGYYDDLYLGDIPVSTKEINEKLKFSVYPNPADEAFTLLIPGFIVEDLKLSMYDCTGRNVMEKTVKDSQTTFDINSKAGVYILCLQGKEGIYTSRLVVL